jgi:hypothetical protein
MAKKTFNFEYHGNDENVSSLVGKSFCKDQSGQTKSMNFIRQMQNTAFIFVPILSFSLLCEKYARDPLRDKCYNSFRYTLPARKESHILYRNDPFRQAAASYSTLELLGL